MTIAAVDVFSYSLRLNRSMPGKSGGIQERIGYLLKLVSETDVGGWGEAAPLPGFSRESFEETGRQLMTLRRWLPGVTVPENTEMLSGAFSMWLDSRELFPSVRCAVEMATLNLLASQQSRPLACLLTQRPTESIALNGLITDDMSVTEATRDCRQNGYRAVKLKVGGGSVERDIERVRELHSQLGGSVAVRLDANRAWSFDEAMRFANAIADCYPEYIEEPLAEPVQLRELATRTGLPVALDETLLDMTPSQLREHDYARAVILKPTLLGGFELAAGFAGVAVEMGIKVVVSSSFESSVGIAALANFAAAYSAPNTAAGLDTLNWFENDLLIEPVEPSHGRLQIEQVSRAAASVDESLLTRLSDD